MYGCHLYATNGSIDIDVYRPDQYNRKVREACFNLLSLPITSLAFTFTREGE